MKLIRRYGFASLFLLFIWSCTKQEEINPLLVGNWQLRESYNWGCFSSGKTFPKPDERIILHFTPSRLYTITRNDSLTETGTYQLAMGQDLDTGKKQLQLTLNRKPSTSTDSLHWTQNVYELNTQNLSVGISFGSSSSGSAYTRVH